MSEGYHMATIKLTSHAEIQDVDSLETIFRQRWNMHADIDLSEGEIHLWRCPDRDFDVDDVVYEE